MRDRTEQIIVSADRQRTRADLDYAAAKAASGFAASGIGDGDAIALLLHNDFACLEAQLAARMIGAFTVPINWHETPAEIFRILAESGAKAVVAHTDLAEAVHLPAGRRLPIFLVETPSNIRIDFGIDAAAGQLTSGTTGWDQWIAGFPPRKQTEAGPVSPIIYTSGSTGRPKGVRREGSTNASSKAMRVYGLDLPGRLRVLVNGPLYHSVPNAYARLALQAGADIVLEPRFRAEETLKLISQYEITHLHIVPAAMMHLLRLPESLRQRYDLGSLRHVVHGAAPCSPAIKRAMIEWWGPILNEYYGSTETGLVTFATSRDFCDRPSTVGRPLPGISLKILDREGDELGAGKVGRVFATSKTLHRFSYVERPDARNAVSHGDLVTAGDVGRLDADGYLHLLGREADLIHTGGRDIAVADIEAAILQYEGVRDCAAFGLMSESANAIIYVCVETDQDEINAAALALLVKNAVGTNDLDLRFKKIDVMPREESGKVFKQRLQEFFALG